MTVSRLAVLGLAAIVLSGCGSPPGTGEFQAMPFETALAKAKDENRVVLLDFSAEWCPPCKMLEEKTWPDPEVRGWLGRHVIPVKVDVDENKPLAEKFGIKTIPTLIFIRPDGSEVGRLGGFMPPKKFLFEAEEVLK